MNELVLINGKSIKVKEYQGHRAITFKDIDTVHERPEGTASKNFRNNKEHFIIGTDYFEIKKSDVGEEFTGTYGFDKFAPAGYVITESGYLMLVKSLTDDLAWKVQRELVNNYFRTDPYKGLSKELKAVLILDKKTQAIESRVNNLEANMPLFNVECKELQALVRKIGIKALGGYRCPAYKDNSLRGKIYSDIQNQLKREFGVTRYEAIKRSQFDNAKRIVEGYNAPMVLIEQIESENSQIGLAI